MSSHVLLHYDWNMNHRIHIRILNFSTHQPSPYCVHNIPSLSGEYVLVSLHSILSSFLMAYARSKWRSSPRYIHAQTYMPLACLDMFSYQSASCQTCHIHHYFGWIYEQTKQVKSECCSSSYGQPVVLWSLLCAQHIDLEHAVLCIQSYKSMCSYNKLLCLADFLM